MYQFTALTAPSSQRRHAGPFGHVGPPRPGGFFGCSDLHFADLDRVSNYNDCELLNQSTSLPSTAHDGLVHWTSRRLIIHFSSYSGRTRVFAPPKCRLIRTSLLRAAFTKTTIYTCRCHLSREHQEPSTRPTRNPAIPCTAQLPLRSKTSKWAAR